ncbi:BolA family protein [Accumulibacter sp.]|uniref:BolA family transcriptional regulator n=1 Tax=Candidatus Accumulibacter proximus TaxID=2954385 RepID=A0A935UHM3_9PROT|nr:BolA family protein [Accumulibacter sp.]MBK7676867.1 BolA family transcriptional regulator [Candidatus Accumulibacter proximus]MBL8375958.1 BolA family transcriptional regulator [Accumulibacter sp.]
MMQPEEVERIIAAGLPCERLQVAGDGHHFEALIVSAEFAGKNRVQRQQRVNEVLRQHFNSGELHALSMKTQTPEEWRAARG